MPAFRNIIFGVHSLHRKPSMRLPSPDRRRFVVVKSKETRHCALLCLRLAFKLAIFSSADLVSAGDSIFLSLARGPSEQSFNESALSGRRYTSKKSSMRRLVSALVAADWYRMETVRTPSTPSKTLVFLELSSRQAERTSTDTNSTLWSLFGTRRSTNSLYYC